MNYFDEGAYITIWDDGDLWQLQVHELIEYLRVKIEYDGQLNLHECLLGEQLPKPEIVLSSADSVGQLKVILKSLEKSLEEINCHDCKKPIGSLVFKNDMDERICKDCYRKNYYLCDKCKSIVYHQDNCPNCED